MALNYLYCKIFTSRRVNVSCSNKVMLILLYFQFKYHKFSVGKSKNSKFIWEMLELV